MRKQQQNSTAKGRFIKNPGRRVDEHHSPAPHSVSLPDAPGVSAVMDRARIPYERRPLSEDEALNLICDARKHEPVQPIAKLLNEYKQDLGE